MKKLMIPWLALLVGCTSYADSYDAPKKEKDAHMEHPASPDHEEETPKCEAGTCHVQLVAPNRVVEELEPICKTDCCPQMDCCPQACCSMDCCEDWCSGWQVEGDYLYWRATRSALDYAATGTLDNGKIRSIDPDYDSGYRIGVFKYFDCQDWDFGVRYTHFDSKTCDRRVAGSGTLNPTRSITFTDLSRAEACYKVELNMVDLLAGFTHCFECMDAYAHCFGGVRLAWIDQRLQADYLSATTPQNIRVKQKLDMDGYGLICGLEGRLGFCDSRFGITGRCATSILHACFDNAVFQEDDGTVQVDFCNNDIISKVPVFEIGAGLDWNVCCNDCWDLGLAVGYEFQAWRGPDFLFQNPAITSGIAPSRNRAFLGFQGLYVRASVGF